MTTNSSSMLDQSAENGDSWIADLEEALMTECDLPMLQKICSQKSIPPKLRPEFWQACLGVKDKEVTLDDRFDLEEQEVIKASCQQLLEKIGRSQDDELLEQTESILTTFSKSTGLRFTPSNGWVEVLSPLLELQLSSTELYNCFAKIVQSYIPRCFSLSIEEDDNDKVLSGQPYHLLRLLLLYHEPELLSYLDTKRIMPEVYANTWFRSLFAYHCDVKVSQALWDIYFQTADPFLVFYLSLVMLVNVKETIFEMETANKEDIIKIIKTVPESLDIDDVDDMFYLVAKHYTAKTPSSIREFHPLIFTSSKNDPCVINRNLATSLCLPVPVWDLLPTAKNGVRYFVIDCRPAEQYNYGHLSTAFHLDCNLMLNDRNAFEMAVEGLLAVQQQAIEANSVAGGHHICFMGSGRNEEDQFTYMVISWFLQKNYKFISLAEGGYSSLHEMVMRNDQLDKYIVDHDGRHCVACTESVPNSRSHLRLNIANNGRPLSESFSGSASNSDAESSSSSIFDKMSSIVRSKSIEMRGRLADIISSPTEHVSASDKIGKRYHPSGKTLGESDDGLYDEESDDSNQELNVEQWSKDMKAIATYKCHELKEDGHMYPSYMILTETHIYVLKELSHNKGWAKIVAKRPLSMIVQITSKRRCPDLITFKYGQESGDATDTPTVMATDMLLIPKPYDVTRLVKQQVIRVLDGEAEEAGIPPSGT
ncbi:TBC1 domain family member 23 [Halotydeus destructor]|nr:TBC1 domain family member 23 [Halotydeus destructor]